jgi:transposase
MPEIWYYKEIRNLQHEIKRLKKEKEQLKKELDDERRKRQQAEEELKHIAERKKSKPPKLNYSVASQEKKMGKQKRKKSPGRRPNTAKAGEADLVKNIYPNGVSFDHCHYHRSITVTRLIDGKAVRILYRIYQTKDGTRTGQLPDVLPNGEYGIDVAVALAVLVYGIEVSIDQACQILHMFTGLSLSKSRADSLLQQLSVLWNKDFDVLKDLIALAMIVHIDETGWKIDDKRCYTWIFTSVLHTVLLYGESRGEEILDLILPRNSFKGIGVSDCLKIYEKRFTQAQKCWAHFLRKAIELMLTHQHHQEYRRFFEELYAIFTDGRKAQDDEALTEHQRKETVASLQARIAQLCTRHEEKIPKETEKDEREFINLQKRMMRNIDDLFTFVLIPEVEATNNRAERGFRKTAKARNNYQTSKTKKGADRRSTIASILRSLQQNMEHCTLQSITEEVIRWRTEGISMFQKQLQIAQMGRSP